MSDDIHALAGAYALDALDDIERARFEQHLGRCSTCQEDVDSYRATAARLATSIAVPPPAALRDNLLSEIQTVRQEPAAVRAISQRRRIVAPLLAAAAAVMLIVAGVSLVDARRDRDRAEQVSAIMTAPDAERVALSPTDVAPTGAHGTMVWSASHGKAVVVIDGLPASADGRAYELWFIVDGTPEPAGVMSSDGGPMVATIDAPPGSMEGMGVTEEPAGGSPTPTSPVLLTVTA